MTQPQSPGTTPNSDDRPGPIHARPVRHPLRWVATVFVLILAAMLVSSFVTNERWDFALAFDIMFRPPVIEGMIKGTLLATVLSMVLGVALGTAIAIGRLSPNPVLRNVSFVYTWFFRAIPRYVLLGMIGTGLGYLYSVVDVGLPFGQQLAGWLGLPHDLTFFQLDVKAITGGLAGGVLGLALSEAAYMAEIARAGILSVDKGQTEAAEALGMSRGRTMRRIILPQAMRVIVPPTGNETIAMVKDTSLLIAVPVITELFYQTSTIAFATFKVMAGFVAASLWYLIICSVLMVAQTYLERYFGRGFGEAKVGRQANRRFARPGGMGGA